MITVQEARAILLGQVGATGDETLPLERTPGRFLAADAHAPDAFPRFDMSAVDGYAVGAGQGPWRRIGAVAAGEVLGTALGAAECARIFTGAQVPQGTAAVVMQEHCTERDGSVRSAKGAPSEGANIRRRAEGHHAGDLLLRKGERLGPAAIGMLAAAGLREVRVARRPRTALVRTGGEFIAQGRDPAGRIHGSNEVMLQAALHQAGADLHLPPLMAEDRKEALREALVRAGDGADLVLTTGGASVGEHDLLRPVLEELGATVHFHGVAQKPGKPLLFATLGGTPVLGLPGNPRAVLVAFTIYALPFLHALQGAARPGAREEMLPLAAPLHRKGDRDEFRAARIRQGRVELLADQGSHLLGGLAEADALCHLEAERTELREGDAVRVTHLWP